MKLYQFAYSWSLFIMRGIRITRLFLNYPETFIHCPFGCWWKQAMHMNVKMNANSWYQWNGTHINGIVAEKCMEWLVRKEKCKKERKNVSFVLNERNILNTMLTHISNNKICKHRAYLDLHCIYWDQNTLLME